MATSRLERGRRKKKKKKKKKKKGTWKAGDMVGLLNTALQHLTSLCYYLYERCGCLFFHAHAST
ncbi:hypothetical protein IAQ61_006773 [Plenodomus lingam]|uniref:uncharacterized protein n=1 Tax=Leptosphaeria maculans TaxID=5022 RepID=UPI0033294421|nr:hypothetical protein IAQ61_006773 [Plenodomus lingam]